MTLYQAYLEFLKVDDIYSRENLSEIIYNIDKKHNILHKIIIITSDNATNNDMFYRYLYKRLSRKYDEFFNSIEIRDEEMRFIKDYSQIRCFIYILNLIYKDILKDLGSFIYKEVVTFLNRVEGK